MPQHNPVLSLLDWALKSVECLVKNLVLHTSDKIINQRNLVNLAVVFYVSDVAVMSGMINNQIDKQSQACRDNSRRSDQELCHGARVRLQTVHIGARCSKYTQRCHISLAEGGQNSRQNIWHFCVCLFYFQGVEAAVEMKVKTTNTNKELVIMVSFIELILSDRLTALDLSQISKILRGNLYDRINMLSGLKSLNLGSGTGGWSNMYIEKFSNGIRTMKNLVKFSLCYDCTDSILKILVRNCRKTLRILDVEMSKQVTNISGEFISQCSNIHTLHIFHTGLTEEGHYLILTRLRMLKVLVRGDFLCEALEYINAHDKKKPIFALEEFWSSEDYFFHDDHQMDLVQKMCPRIRKMMFQFNKETMRDLLFLSNFDNLSELHLWVKLWTFYKDY